MEREICGGGRKHGSSSAYGWIGARRRVEEEDLAAPWTVPPQDTRGFSTREELWRAAPYEGRKKGVGFGGSTRWGRERREVSCRGDSGRGR
jgi:hypothetical protein